MQVKNLAYQESTSKILSDVNFDMDEIDKLMIYGENGTGKSTLLKILANILRPSQGEVINKLSIAYVPDSSENYFTGLSALVYFNFLRMNVKINEQEYDNQLFDLMKLLNFSEKLLHRKISLLSLGEKKKVMIIGAFLINPDLYLMDEPLSGLDQESAQNFLKLICTKVEKKKKFIIISHDDIALFKPYDKCLHLYKGGSQLETGEKTQDV